MEFVTYVNKVQNCFIGVRELKQTGLTPSSSSTSLSQVSAQSPVGDSIPQTKEEERLRDQVLLLQKQVGCLEQQINSILNKPKRGVRVQVNSGPIMSSKTTQTRDCQIIKFILPFIDFKHCSCHFRTFGDPLHRQNHRDRRPTPSNPTLAAAVDKAQSGIQRR